MKRKFETIRVYSVNYFRIDQMKRNYYLLAQVEGHSVERHRGQMPNRWEGPRSVLSQRELAIVIRPARPAVVACRTKVRAHRPRWARWAASLPARLWSKLRHAHQQRRASRALNDLNDQLLKDIGISRSDIEYLQHDGETYHSIR
jgi:uncharacterized protein YjiS (DUF1127 family)